jgi:hypothetical protein
VHNAEAAKESADAKLKEQEKLLRADIARAESQVIFSSF